MNVKLGRNRPPASARTKLRLADFRVPSVTAVPNVVDYSGPAMACLTNPYLNTQLGCCIVAGYYHVLGVLTANANGAPFIATDDQIVADYSAISGYVPGSDATDQGCDEDTAIQYWMGTPAADGSVLSGSIEIDPSNEAEVKEAIYLFEHLYLAFEVPDADLNPPPSGNGFAWGTGMPDPNNGHCIMAFGYDTNGVSIDSWGLLGSESWGGLGDLFKAGAGGSCKVLLNADILARAQGRSPLGMDWSALTEAFDRINGPSITLPGP